MTFNEWFVEYNKAKGLPPAYVVAEYAWNAAIEACRDDVSWEHRCMFLAADKALDALKTPLVLDAQEGPKSGYTGSSDSEVVHG